MAHTENNQSQKRWSFYGLLQSLVVHWVKQIQLHATVQKVFFFLQR